MTAGETANNRLCSQDEKEQINALNESCINLSKEFNLELDLEDYRKVSHGNESKYLKKNGVLQESKVETVVSATKASVMILLVILIGGLGLAKMVNLPLFRGLQQKHPRFCVS